MNGGFKKRAFFGFSIIELMVVVALVGILATLGFKTYRDQMAKARDATRVSALGQLKKILQAYEIVEKQFP